MTVSPEDRDELVAAGVVDRADDLTLALMLLAPDQAAPSDRREVDEFAVVPSKPVPASAG